MFQLSTEKWPDTPTKLQICDGDNWSPKISSMINPSQDPDDRPKRYVLKFRIIVRSSVAFRLVATRERCDILGIDFGMARAHWTNIFAQFTDKQSYGTLQCVVPTPTLFLHIYIRHTWRLNFASRKSFYLCSTSTIRVVFADRPTWRSGGIHAPSSFRRSTWP